MSLTLYTAPLSTATHTEAVLDALQVSFERVVLDIDAGETRTPEFRKLNPNARIPVLVHDGAALWESAAIAMHLGEAFGQERGLYPAPGLKRAHTMKWIVWGSATLAEAAGRFSSSLPPEQAGAVQSGSVDFDASSVDHGVVRARAVTDLQDLLGILAGALADQPFLVDDFSIADIHVGGIVGWIAMMEPRFAAHPNVQVWLARCAAKSQDADSSPR